MSSPSSTTSAIDRALLDLCLERGYHHFDLAELRRRAGVDAAEFNRHYADLEDCFCSLLDRMGEEFLAFVGDAVLAESDWRRQMRAASVAMTTFFLADRGRARFMLIDTFGAGERAQLIRDHSINAMVLLIDRGREQLDRPDSLTTATAEAIAGTVYDQMRELARREAGLAEWQHVTPQLMYSVLLPYLGPEAAAEELEVVPLSRRPSVGEGA